MMSDAFSAENSNRNGNGLSHRTESLRLAKLLALALGADNEERNRASATVVLKWRLLKLIFLFRLLNERYWGYGL